MPDVIIQLIKIGTLCVEDTICTLTGPTKGKYGLTVTDETLNTLKLYEQNGYIGLSVAGSPTPVILKKNDVAPVPMPKPVPGQVPEPVTATEEPGNEPIQVPPADDPVPEVEPVTETPIGEQVVAEATPKKRRAKNA